MQLIISLLFLLFTISSAQEACPGHGTLKPLTGAPDVVPGDDSKHTIYFCKGHANPKYPYGCTGECCYWTGTVNQAYGTTAYIGNSVVTTTTYNCLDTDGATQFSVCDSYLSCNNYTVFHPWVTPDDRWIFNTVGKFQVIHEQHPFID